MSTDIQIVYRETSINGHLPTTATSLLQSVFKFEFHKVVFYYMCICFRLYDGHIHKIANFMPFIFFFCCCFFFFSFYIEMLHRISIPKLYFYINTFTAILT